MSFQFVERDAIREVWRCGNWLYFKLWDGSGFWQWDKSVGRP